MRTEIIVKRKLKNILFLSLRVKGTKFNPGIIKTRRINMVPVSIRKIYRSKS